MREFDSRILFNLLDGKTYFEKTSKGQSRESWQVMANDKPEKYSAEWMAELKQFVDAGQRFLANDDDRGRLRCVRGGGTKAGLDCTETGAGTQRV